MKNLKGITVLCPHGHICRPKIVEIPIDTVDTEKILKDNCFFDKAHIVFYCKTCKKFYKSRWIEVDNSVKSSKITGEREIQLEDD